jgi:hypothetical protein
MFFFKPLLQVKARQITLMSSTFVTGKFYQQQKKNRKEKDTHPKTLESVQVCGKSCLYIHEKKNKY